MTELRWLGDGKVSCGDREDSSEAFPGCDRVCGSPREAPSMQLIRGPGLIRAGLTFLTSA